MPVRKAARPKDKPLRDVIRFGQGRAELAAKRCACGSRDAPFGMGPPMRGRMEWFCYPCWTAQPENVADAIDRIAEALDIGEDEDA